MLSVVMEVTKRIASDQRRQASTEDRTEQGCTDGRDGVPVTGGGPGRSEQSGAGEARRGWPGP
jgi:hypothetical protein